MSHHKKGKVDTSRLFDLDVCAFCGSKDNDELLYGDYVDQENIQFHSNCMFLASNLTQNGKLETDGFNGFLLPDIEKELLRGKKLCCAYCHKKGATIGCCEKKCKKSFHLPCGIKNDSLHQFFGQFSSYCKHHKPQQEHIQLSQELKCLCCFEELSPNDLSSCLYSACCKNSWFHKLCIQKYALSAGLHFFKCPLCNDSEKFVEEMKVHGIRVPEKDASWELEAHAYEELLRRVKCDASICLCKSGRSYTPISNSPWTLLPCFYCGSHARHKACANLKLSTNYWICDDCVVIEAESVSTVFAPPSVCSSEKESTLSKDLKSEVKTSTAEYLSSANVSEIPVGMTNIKNSVINDHSTTLEKELNEGEDLKSEVGRQFVNVLKIGLLSNSKMADKIENFEKKSFPQNISFSNITTSSDSSFKDEKVSAFSDTVSTEVLQTKKDETIITGIEKNMDVSCNSKCHSRIILEDKTSETIQIENEVGRENSLNKKLKTCSQDKEANNLITVTEATNRPATRSTSIVKSSSKKSKKKNVHKCHASKLCCIKKYFVSGPFQYRV